MVRSRRTDAPAATWTTRAPRTVKGEQPLAERGRTGYVSARGLGEGAQGALQLPQFRGFRPAVGARGQVRVRPVEIGAGELAVNEGGQQVP